MRPLPLLLSTALAVVTATTAVASSAAAAGTTLGESGSTSGTDRVAGAGYSAFQETSPTGAPTYTVPAGGGVITAWSVVLQGATSSPSRVSLLVGRSEVGGYVVDGADLQPVPVQAATTTLTFTGVRVPVPAGDVLGAWTDGPGVLVRTLSDAVIRVSSGPTSQDEKAHPRPPVTGSAISTDTIATTKDRLLQVAATVEPDADGDGYGDITQDACPADPVAHLAPCPAHLSTTTVVGPDSVGQGGGLSVTTTVKVTGTQAALGLTLTSRSTSGIGLLAARTNQGSCSSATTCSLGRVEPGASVIVVQDVVALTPGSQSIVSTLTGGDQPLLDDTQVTALLSVEVRPAAVQVPVCRVPILVGKGPDRVKRALTRAGCRPGTFHLPHLKAGQKHSQLRAVSANRRAGTVVSRGTRIAVTFAVPGRRR
jgi:hypothetical protein